MMDNAAKRRGLRSWAAAVVLSFLAAGPALAHKVNVFATVNNGAIEGECYSSGGGKLKECLVEFYDSSGEKLGETRTDADGRFRFEPTAQTDHRIVLDTGDGHRAEYTVPVGELPASYPAAAPATTPSDAGDIERRISESVEKAIRPLRQQLDQWENKVRLHDVLGGVGYIFGLAGVVLYFKSKRRPTA